MAWTTVDDIKDRWIGNDVPSDADLLGVLITDAEDSITTVYPNIQEWIDDGKLSVATVKRVVFRLVSTELRNPENLTYFQRTTGPFGSGKNYGQRRRGYMALTEADMEALSPLKRGGRAFSIDLDPNPNYLVNRPSQWL